jgi:hypothetical protein
MKKYIATLTLSLALGACATTPYTGDVVTETKTPGGLNVIQTSSRSLLSSGKIAGQESELTQITATVEAINYKTRAVTLLTEAGRLVSLTVSPEVQNFSQVKKGDKLTLDYFESVEFEIRQPTEQERQLAGIEIDAGASAAKGEKPTAVVAGQRIDILSVESIDRKKALITLKGQDGYVTVKSKYPQNMRFVKVGDTVVVKSSELFAARIKSIG